MYIKSLIVNNFRAFQAKTRINFGRYITAIAGMNGVGKSTILAIIANSSQLHARGNKYRMIDHSQFKGEFSDIIHYDFNHDKTGKKATIIFSKNIYKHNNELKFRAAVQKRKASKNIRKKYLYRYRLIPRKIKNEWNSNSKLKWPVAYLGLSRIYPVGEATSTKSSPISKKLSDEIIKAHAYIMDESISLKTSSFQNIKLGNLGRKRSGTGINTKKYSATSNSSGQDDLGKIISTVLSFQVLKQRYSNYNGGLVTIDELDATLHPAAQKRLVDWLYKKAKELQIQIVFTTHSFSLLHHIYNKITHNKSRYIKINYLEKYSKGVIVYSHPTLKQTYYDLNDRKGIKYPHKVKLLTEDEISRKYLRDIFNCFGNYAYFNDRVKLIKGHIDWKEIVRLHNNIPNILCIVDPDVNQINNKVVFNKMLKKSTVSNNSIFILPGKYAIEVMLWRYLSSLNKDSQLYKSPIAKDMGISISRTYKDSLKYKLDTISPIKTKNGHKKTQSMTTKCKYWYRSNGALNSIYMKYLINDKKLNIRSFMNRLLKTMNEIYKHINDPFIAR